MGEMLSKLSAGAQKEETKESNNKSNSSLKSSRGDSGENSKSSLASGALSGSSRLLNSALSSSRGPVKQNDNASKVGNKRNANELEPKVSYRNAVTGGEGNQQFNNKHYRPNANNQHQQHPHQFNQPHFQQAVHQPFHQQPQQPPYPPGPVAHAGPAGGPGLDTVKYFEQMNAVALASGFRNAQEMLASQREMMTLMSQGPAALTAPVHQQHPPLPPTPLLERSVADVVRAEGIRAVVSSRVMSRVVDVVAGDSFLERDVDFLRLRRWLYLWKPVLWLLMARSQQRLLLLCTPGWRQLLVLVVIAEEVLRVEGRLVVDVVGAEVLFLVRMALWLLPLTKF
eukprot:gene29893-37022_t